MPGICRFFQRGYCKFGDRCRFLHPGASRDGYSGGYSGSNDFNAQNGSFTSLYQKQNNNYNGGSAGSLSGNRFAPLATGTKSQPNASFNSMNIDEIVKQIAEDLSLAVNGKMWPLSCYSPGSTAPCLPGLDDLSPEEMRLEAYNNEKNGTAQIYREKIAQTLSESMHKKSLLIKPDYEVKQSLIAEIKKMQNMSSSRTASFAGSSVTTDSSRAGTGLFGQAATAMGVFGGGQTVSAGQSVFGGSSNSNPNISGSGLFGKAAAAMNLTSTSNQASSSNFAGGASNTSVFESSGTSSGFIQTGQSHGEGLFGKSSTTTNVFGTSSSASVFGGTQSANSVFGGKQTEVALGQSSVSQQPIQNQDTNTAKVLSSIYTELDKLSSEEKGEFEAVKFTLGKIPTRPPPRELV